jgi:hypothetical protein
LVVAIVGWLEIEVVNETVEEEGEQDELRTEKIDCCWL